jgi:hypothetical protein
MRSEFRAPTGQMTAVRSEKVAGVRLIDGAIFDSKESPLWSALPSSTSTVGSFMTSKAPKSSSSPANWLATSCGRAQLRKTFD